MILHGSSLKLVAEIISIELDIKGLSSKALKVLTAAVTIGLRNRGVQLHNVPIADFCELADLPAATSSSELSSLLTEARNVLGSVEVISTGGQSRDETWGSWPVFNEVFLSSGQISFEISRPMYQPDVHVILLGGSPGLLPLCP